VEVRDINEWPDQVGNILVESIRQAGVNFGTRCPMDGEYQIGDTWAETH